MLTTLKAPQYRKRFIAALVALNVGKMAEIVNDVLKDYFAQYLVTDTNGTWLLCWTEKGAFSWLAYCSESATIQNVGMGEIIATRKQGA